MIEKNGFVDCTHQVGITESLGPPEGPEERAAFSMLIIRAVIIC